MGVDEKIGDAPGFELAQGVGKKRDAPQGQQGFGGVPSEGTQARAQPGGEDQGFGGFLPRNFMTIWRSFHTCGLTAGNLTMYAGA